MKSLLLTLGLFAGSQAFAAHAKNCNPYIVSNGGESAAQEYVYPCGENYTVTYRGCLEGEIGHFPVSDSTSGGEGGTREETRVCHNGTFFPHGAKMVHHRGCIEGEIGYTGIYQGGEAETQVAIVCKHGKFVRVNP